MRVKTDTGLSELEFEKLFMELEKMAFNFAYSIVLNSEDAKDAVQEGFLKLYRSKEKLDKNKNIKAYLFQIIKNVCFDILRSKRNTQEIENTTIKINNSRETELDRKQIIKEAMNILTTQERMIIGLLMFEGFTSKEAGEIMNLSDSTIRNHFMNGRKKIKNFILKNYPDYARSL